EIVVVVAAVVLGTVVVGAVAVLAVTRRRALLRAVTGTAGRRTIAGTRAARSRTLRRAAMEVGVVMVLPVPVVIVVVAVAVAVLPLVFLGLMLVELGVLAEARVVALEFV